MLLNYNIRGTGLHKVIVMHDWFCDITSYDLLIPYLDIQRFSYIFVNLRGYGGSRNIKGDYTHEEAASDIISLVDELKISEYHLIGHSMSGMIAQYVALKDLRRVKSVVAITPVPACGSPADDSTKDFMRTAARGGVEHAHQIIGMMTGDRYNKQFIDYKTQKWFATSIPQAREEYMQMFTSTDFSEKAKGLNIPFLVISGKYDFIGYQKENMQNTFEKWYPKCEIKVIEECGHYPMLETPVQLISLIEKFLNSVTKG